MVTATMTSLKPRARRIITSIIVLLGLSLLYVCDHGLKNVSEAKEAEFISAHFLAMMALTEDPPEGRPDTFYDLLKGHPDFEAMLLRDFPQGLVYQQSRDGFVLEEPTPHFVSLFRRDRLVSTNNNRPHWERSGKTATKG